MLNQTTEDYLKTIYELAECSDKVTTKAIAEKLKVSSPSVTEMTRKLAAKKLLVYKPYHGVKLTKAGEKVALEMIRHHRLIELYLQEALGIPWDRVHAEAEKWEHFISEDVEDRMDAKLGFPKVDPHGAQIPTRDGVLPIRRKCETLDTLQAGDKGVVAEVSDHDSELLGYLGNIDIFPRSSIEVRSIEPFDGPMTISVNGHKRIIGKNVAVYISITDIEKKQAEPKRASGGKQ
ncbi:MAG: metal-dependent transcriptional regulator [Candidatus Mycalebacterium zealandia]|nr:MAG: metal-dependent transcriptional regulator [Candidatus Mycalebacterium zealandia]